MDSDIICAVCFQLGEGHDQTKDSSGFLKQLDSDTICAVCFQLGERHDRTKESSECLKHLTQQAVVLQKKMNEIYKGDRSISFPPIQVRPCREKVIRL